MHTMNEVMSQARIQAQAEAFESEDAKRYYKTYGAPGEKGEAIAQWQNGWSAATEAAQAYLRTVSIEKA